MSTCLLLFGRHHHGLRSPAGVIVLPDVRGSWGMLILSMRRLVSSG
jgi:hypothetical protein